MMLMMMMMMMVMMMMMMMMMMNKTSYFETYSAGVQFWGTEKSTKGHRRPILFCHFIFYLFILKFIC